MPDLQEKVFFGQTRHDLEKITGVTNMEELVQAENLSLKPTIFKASQRLYQNTLDDFKERYAFFETDGDEVFTSREGACGEINIKTLEARGWESGPLDVVKLFFGKPKPIFFHTHPRITPVYLEMKGAHTPKMYGQPVTLEQAAQLLTFALGIFSDSDLVFVEKGTRYFRSLLLTTALGTSWIINPNFKIPLSSLSKKDSDNYWKQINPLISDIHKAALESGDIGTVLNERAGELEKPLSDFCTRKGLLLFRNTDPDSPDLKRVLD